MLLHASWEDVVFLHFLVEPREMRRRLPAPLRLDLPLGEAWLTVVGLRSRGPAPLPPRLLRGVPPYSQVNLRTYVLLDGEPGVFFLDQAVSSPTVAAAARLIGVHEHGAEVTLRRVDDVIHVRLADRRGALRDAPDAEAALEARLRIAGPTLSAKNDVIGRALLERYVAFDGDPPRRTRVEHAPWVIQRLEVESLQSSHVLPSGARLAAAHYGTPRVVAVGVPHAVLRPVLGQPSAEPA
jgi:uncharacterized protein YqjF (DUF2071 family)